MLRPARRLAVLLNALLALVVSIGALPPATASGASALPGQATIRASQDRIDAYVNERIAAWSIPGLALAIVEDGQVTLTRGYGLADREQKRAMTPQTPVAIGSATKPITATAVMQLVEAGKVELDAPVIRYLPWFNLDDDP